ncbi:MAG: HlyC/CorC family transporter [Gemmatimonadaceae bacterium]|nr:HlyC/CorC family transporter [Gemmatimonadaceae bacterium]
MRIVAVLLLIAANAFFVAAELALVRARRPRLEELSRAGDRAARIALRALDRTPRVLAASELGTTLSTLALGWLLAAWWLPLGAARESAGDAGSAGSARGIVLLVVALLVTIYLHIVFGALTPRAAALARPERAARYLVPPLLVFAWITYPLTALLAGSFQRINRRIRAVTPPREASAAHGPDELRLLVEQSEELGTLEREDAALLQGVFAFSEKTARDVMTPRTEIVAIPIEATLDETLHVVEESGRSRCPVYERTIDNIVGLVLAKDLLPLAHHPPAAFTLRTLLRPVPMIPATREIEDVLADFKRRRVRMAVVLDEYGGTAGIVTLSDLLEEIVGAIPEEYGEGEPPAAAPPAAPGELVVPGEMGIAELNEVHDLAVPEGEYATIGGFVFGTLGRVPRVGDHVTAGGAVFTVRALEGRRVASLTVQRVPTERASAP